MGERERGVSGTWRPLGTHSLSRRLPVMYQQVDGAPRVTPGWLERGLTKLDTAGAPLGSQQVVLVSRVAVPSGGEGAGRKPVAASPDGPAGNYSYIRGQNVPLDPLIMQEREMKRQKALEHQSAIRQQLEERDRKRKAEIEKRLKEERAEDERIRKEQEREKLRYDEEQRKKREKEEQESQKAAKMREALQNADKMAREEKSLANRKHLQQNVIEFPKEIECNACITCTGSPPDSSKWYRDKSTTSEDEIVPSALLTKPPPPENRDFIKVEKEQGNGSKNSTKTKEKFVKTGLGHEKEERRRESVVIMAEPMMTSKDGLPKVVGGDLKKVELKELRGEGVQVSLLMSPRYGGGDQANRTLTPSKFRRPARECATQTEEAAAGREERKKARKVRVHEREKSASLERTPHDSRQSQSYKSRSQSQPRPSLEDRPKWGVNRPDTQYRKQSEKDPYYQRRLRKRQNERVVIAGGDTGTDTDTWTRNRQRNYNSDDYSRSPSPAVRSYARKNRNQNRKKQTKYSKSNKTKDKPEIYPDSPVLSAIESYDDEIYSPSPVNNMSRKNHERHINDRFEDVTNQSRSPVARRKEVPSVDVPHYMVKGKRLLKREQESPLTIEVTDRDVGQWSGDDSILSQLTLLRNGLRLKQQEWDNPRCQTSFSESSLYSTS